MAAPYLVNGAGGSKLFFGELADRLQQPVTNVGPHLFGGDQRFAHQRVQLIHHAVLVQPVGAYVSGRGEIEPAGEHRTTAQHRPFVVIEQVIGPLHGVAQRLVAFQRAAGPRQQTEPIAETITHVDRTHRHHPRRGQLDRQRDPIQPTTDVCH